MLNGDFQQAFAGAKFGKTGDVAKPESGDRKPETLGTQKPDTENWVAGNGRSATEPKQLPMPFEIF
jgi:hypothetical protein